MSRSSMDVRLPPPSGRPGRRGIRRPAPAGRWGAFLLLALSTQAVMAWESSWAQAQRIPAWAATAFESPGFTKDYVVSTHLDPSLLQADFNGDVRPDVAVLVVRRGTGAKGVAILHAGSKEPRVVGAGHAIGNGGADFSWMDGWSVFPKAPIRSGAGELAPPRLLGDALLVEKLEAASAVIFWDGAAYRWYQQGD